MKKKIAVLSVLLLVVGIPAYSTLITFDEPGLTPGTSATGTQITNELSSFGLLFSITDGIEFVSNPTFLSSPGSATGNFLAVKSTTSTPAVLTIDFIDPLSLNPTVVSAFSFAVDVYDTEQSVTVNSFDLGGNPLETLVLSFTGDQSSVAHGAFTLGGIHSVQFVDVGADGHILDNLAFTSVPEPGTFALLGAGLIGLSLALRRRKQG